MHGELRETPKLGYYLSGGGRVQAVDSIVTALTVLSKLERALDVHAPWRFLLPSSTTRENGRTS